MQMIASGPIQGNDVDSTASIREGFARRPRYNHRHSEKAVVGLSMKNVEYFLPLSTDERLCLNPVTKHEVYSP